MVSRHCEETVIHPKLRAALEGLSLRNEGLLDSVVGVQDDLASVVRNTFMYHG